MRKILLGLIIASCLFSSSAFACSDFLVKAKDNTVVVGRSMEFPLRLKSKVLVVPRQTTYFSVYENGEKGITWTTQYGFLGINAYGLKDTFVEGFNEKGLTIDGLMFTGAVYEPFAANRSVPLDYIAAWALGNFSTVEEVKNALPTVNITSAISNKLKSMGLHLAMHDAQGNSLVVEFINGEKKIYDNPLGVMTNRPEFDWQLTNLRNYINLGAEDRAPKKINGVEFEPTGVGSGLLGLPGDFTPPSRFVRLALEIDAAIKPKDEKEAVNLAEHLLNVVDIPKGTIKEPTKVPVVDLYGNAEWVIIKDLTNQVLYFKTYENTVWKSVDLKKFDLAPGNTVKSLAIDDGQTPINDVSNQLK